jgi:hypothetical protein
MKVSRRTAIGGLSLNSRRPRAHKNRNGHPARVPSTRIEAPRAGPNEDAQAIEDRVRTFSENELLVRYHDLVDQRFERPLEYTERFELERIEARLDFEAGDELKHVTAERRSWEGERGELVASLERLLSEFRVAR